MWRIVFVGNCQAFALADIFRRAIDPALGTETRHVPSHAPLSPDAAAALEAADLLIEQLFDFPAPIAGDLAARARRARRALFPDCEASFLWPYAYEGHPRNVRAPHAGGEGPFSAELGDAFLNRMLAEGVGWEEALARYLALDIAEAVRLERRREMGLAAQARRDQAAGGYPVAALLRAEGAEAPLFLTPRHPGRRVLFALITRLGEIIGLPRWLLRRLPGAITTLPFTDEELPVHPGVARHFGLKWAGPERRYHIWWAGRVTFADYVRIYMNFAWNEALALGRHCADRGELAEARAHLEAGLAAGPEAAAGWRLLSHVRHALGDAAGARAAIAEALAREPGEADDWVHLGNLCHLLGDAAGAEAAYRRALEAVPGFRPALRAWAVAREQAGWAAAGAAGVALRAEAGAVFEALAREDPWDAETFLAFGHARAALGRRAEALAAFRLAALAAPFRAEARRALSYALLAVGDGASALEEGEAALALDPRESAFRRHLLALALRGAGMGRARQLMEGLRARLAGPERAALAREWLEVLVEAEAGAAGTEEAGGVEAASFLPGSAKAEGAAKGATPAGMTGARGGVLILLPGRPASGLVELPRRGMRATAGVPPEEKSA